MKQRIPLKSGAGSLAGSGLAYLLIYLSQFTKHPMDMDTALQISAFMGFAASYVEGHFR